MRLIALLLALFPLAVSAQQDSRLQSLQTGDAGRGWEAVGRLNMQGVGFCTATLISERLVLTAAHCLFDRRTGARLSEDRLEFLAGWRTGRAEAIRGIRRASIWPQFDVAAGAALGNVPADIALLELDRPVRTTAIFPFRLADRGLETGDSVAVISYARNRAEAPSIQESCHVIEQRRDGITVFSCDIDYGASGSPGFIVEAGEPRIVSVISARVESTERPLSLGMAFGDRVRLLAEDLARGGVLPAAPGAGEGARRAARFVRP
ncbi:trypsin-like serine peptidase [Pararhodobacter marinus]|uniref:trypsin-like serine peptidase n=1 Tax=Pararhodobacter marinus TaxID=2184063 RepID=UPI003512BDDA